MAKEIDVDITSAGMIHFAQHDCAHVYCGAKTEKTIKTLTSYSELKDFLNNNKSICCYTCTLAAYRKEFGVFIDGVWSFYVNGWPSTAVFPEGHFEKKEVIL